MSTLDTLPLEILFQILGFISSPRNPTSASFHPINSLAAASKHFDSAVEEYTRLLLKQHANFTPQRKSKVYTSRKKWLAEICQLCYKKSKRRSTLWRNLTCCLVCDKRHFAKVTMSNAVKQGGISKLDIFTPNRLHPTLPPLAHGEFSVLGGVATMIYEPDFIARRNCIQGCLSERDRLGVSLRQRVRRHEALIAHMEIAYSTACKTWYRRPCAHEKGEEKSGRASMKTEESRNEFVRKGLEHERALMHTKGSSESMAIEID